MLDEVQLSEWDAKVCSSCVVYEGAAKLGTNKLTSEIKRILGIMG